VSPPSWSTPLPSAVGSWQWRQQDRTVQLPAGCVITGVGVAVGVRGSQQGSENAKMNVLALIGKVHVAVV
jgi:hypothetical protein